MQHTYRISKAASILSYLPRFIKIVRADFERSANMPKHPLINYPPLYPLLHKTPKNRISVLVFSHIQSFIVIPLVGTFVSSNRHRVPTALKKTFSDSWDIKTWRFISVSTSLFFPRWQYFSYRESKNCCLVTKRTVGDLELFVAETKWFKVPFLTNTSVDVTKFLIQGESKNMVEGKNYCLQYNVNLKGENFRLMNVSLIR